LRDPRESEFRADEQRETSRGSPHKKTRPDLRAGVPDDVPGKRQRESNISKGRKN